MTLTEIREAVTAADPAAALDRLIRRDLALGRPTAAIHAELLPLVRAVRTATPPSEDVDEILLGTLDALTGDCNPDECYHDAAGTVADRVRAAWESATPQALDRAAESLARDGVPEAIILAAVDSLLADVRAAGADEETEEAIHGVMDRLSGWCHPSGHIHPTHPPGTNGTPATPPVVAPAG